MPHREEAFKQTQNWMERLYCIFKAGLGIASKNWRKSWDRGLWISATTAQHHRWMGNVEYGVCHNAVKMSAGHNKPFSLFFIIVEATEQIGLVCELSTWCVSVTVCASNSIHQHITYKLSKKINLGNK